MFGSALKERIMGVFHQGTADTYRDEVETIEIERPDYSFEEEFVRSPIMALYINSSWEIEKLNSAASSVFGAHASSLEGKPFLALVDTSYAQNFLNQMHKALASGQTETEQLKFRKIQGPVFWANCEMTPVFDEHGKLRHFMTVLSEVGR